jgi:hypothetical protein
MHKRLLGKGSVKVSPIMLGGNVFGWSADEATSFRVTRRFRRPGIQMSSMRRMYILPIYPAVLVAKGSVTNSHPREQRLCNRTQGYRA